MRRISGVKNLLNDEVVLCKRRALREDNNKEEQNENQLGHYCLCRNVY